MEFIQNRTELLQRLELKDKICVEVGVQRGNFSHHIHLCNPYCLYLVDCWEQQSSSVYRDGINGGANVSNEQHIANYQSVIERFKRKSNVVVIRGYSLVVADLEFKNGSIDMVYIDANHSYDAVLADLKAWYPKVKTGGWICGHDYMENDVFGVKKAVEKFLSETGETLHFLTREMFPSFAFRKFAVGKM